MTLAATASMVAGLRGGGGGSTSASTSASEHRRTLPPTPGSSADVASVRSCPDRVAVFALAAALEREFAQTPELRDFERAFLRARASWANWKSERTLTRNALCEADLRTRILTFIDASAASAVVGLALIDVIPEWRAAGLAELLTRPTFVDSRFLRHVLIRILGGMPGAVPYLRDVASSDDAAMGAMALNSLLASGDAAWIGRWLEDRAPGIIPEYAEFVGNCLRAGLRVPDNTLHALLDSDSRKVVQETLSGLEESGRISALALEDVERLACDPRRPRLVIQAVQVIRQTSPQDSVASLERIAGHQACPIAARIAALRALQADPERGVGAAVAALALARTSESPWEVFQAVEVASRARVVEPACQLIAEWGRSRPTESILLEGYLSECRNPLVRDLAGHCASAAAGSE